MPFKSFIQEFYMKKHLPKLYREWLRKYGHAPGYRKAVSRINKNKSSNKRRKKKI